ncbi:MAG: DUF3791 domain-containing protein [Phocaeicola plebeius]|nr:DUF3791 domain-containing protein [Phocaeicola plebeius]
MKSEVEEKATFASFCIEQYAKAKNMPTEKVSICSRDMV